jgi:hypothetical protein
MSRSCWLGHHASAGIDTNAFWSDSKFIAYVVTLIDESESVMLYNPALRLAG